MSFQVGLCANCVHVRRIPHPRGGPAYVLCGRAETDPTFPKYPRLPVLECRGYERQASTDDESNAD